MKKQPLILALVTIIFLIRAGRDGRIYFVLPCVGLEEHYLIEYLSEFERKAAYLLLSANKK